MPNVQDFTSKLIRLGPLKIRRIFNGNILQENRRFLSYKYLTGSGIEIGALHSPIVVRPGVKVARVDRFSVSELRAHYPELGSVDIAEPDIIDDGEMLSSISNESLNFIVANHFIEHCENPLGTIRNHLEKLQKGGVLFYAIPNKRYTFDYMRSVTPFNHLVEDDRNGPEHSRVRHYEEWARDVDGIKDPRERQIRAENLNNMKYSIHFHVWDFRSLKEHLEMARNYLDKKFDIQEIKKSDIEVIAVLSKTS